MDFTWIRTFLRVAELRSFTRAADDLHLSQPAVSRQVRKLEEELQATLIDRSSGSLELTPAGESFREFAARALDQYQAVVDEIQGSRAQLSGPLRIAASTIPGEFLAPELVIQFARIHPLVEPHIMIGDTTIVIDELLSGRYDVGFVGAKLASREIRYRSIAEDEIVLAVPVSHPFANRAEIELDELTDQPFIEREEGSGTAISVRRSLGKLGRDLPAFRTVMRLSSTDAVLSAVERGYGIGWASTLALERRGSENVSVTRLVELPLARTLYLATPNRRALSSVATAFIDWLIETQSTPSEPDAGSGS